MERRLLYSDWGSKDGMLFCRANRRSARGVPSGDEGVVGVEDDPGAARELGLPVGLWLQV